VLFAYLNYKGRVLLTCCVNIIGLFSILKLGFASIFSFSSGSYGLESSHFMSSGQLRGAAEVYQPDALPVVIQGVRVEQLSNSVKGLVTLYLELKIS